MMDNNERRSDLHKRLGVARDEATAPAKPRTNKVESITLFISYIINNNNINGFEIFIAVIFYNSLFLKMIFSVYFEFWCGILDIYPCF